MRNKTFIELFEVELRRIRLSDCQINPMFDEVTRQFARLKKLYEDDTRMEIEIPIKYKMRDNSNGD